MHSLIKLIGSALCIGLPVWSLQAQTTTTSQLATAQQVAQAGVALSELAPDAPDRYTVKSGDTLWAISSLFLKSPWRWPELWGMNMQEIKNPHRIYPGQQLVLDKSSGRAVLTTRPAEAGPQSPTETIKVSPRTRFASLADTALTTLAPQLIEPFLAEPMIVDEQALRAAPRIVATQEGRVMVSRGDRAYARAVNPADLAMGPGATRVFRVFRDAKPLKDPGTGEVIAYEAQYVGRAELARGEMVREARGKDGKPMPEIVPATIDIVSAKEEMRVGDRLLPEPAREFMSYTPHAPEGKLAGRIVSVYGSAVRIATQNQVVAINRGKKDGLETGHILAILKDGVATQDRTDPTLPQIKLPDERNGLLMVFRTFDRVSYALVLQVTDGLQVGDHIVNPR